MTKKEYFQIFNLIGFIATVIVNFLAVLLPIGDMPNSEVDLTDDQLLKNYRMLSLTYLFQRGLHFQFGASYISF